MIVYDCSVSIDMDERDKWAEERVRNSAAESNGEDSYVVIGSSVSFEKTVQQAH